MEHKIEDILDAALKSQNGVCVRFDNEYGAIYTRRRCYAWREDMRLIDNLKYDQLSFMIKELTELWIIPQKALHTDKNVTFDGIRILSAEELPERILSRGKSKVGTTF